MLSSCKLLTKPLLSGVYNQSIISSNVLKRIIVFYSSKTCDSGKSGKGKSESPCPPTSSGSEKKGSGKCKSEPPCPPTSSCSEKKGSEGSKEPCDPCSTPCPPPSPPPCPPPCECPPCDSPPCDSSPSSPSVYDQRKYGHCLPKNDVNVCFEPLPNIATGIFRKTDGEVLGLGAGKCCLYKNPEYFSNHHMTYYDMHLIMRCFRKPSPDTGRKP